MAHALDSRASSPANDLRDTLDLVERLIVSPNADTIETLLTSLDKISAMFNDLTQTNIDLRSEEVRWEGILRRLQSKPGKIAAAANAVGGFDKLRAQHPPADEEWWRLDQVISERRQQSLFKGLQTLTVIALIGLIVYLLLPEPNPDAVFVLETEAVLEDAMMAGELDEAQVAAISAAEQLPTSPELWLWATVLSEQVGDDVTAERSLENAMALMPDQPVSVWVDLGNKRLQLQDFDGAEAAANEALAIDDQEPQGYFLLGGVAEMRGEKRLAIDYFEQTFALAEIDDPQLAVIAKVRMGTLLQSLDPFGGDDSSSESAPASE